MRKNIVIQGFDGSFHQVAANNFFKEKVNFIFCKYFTEVFDKMASDIKNDYAVVAIENSIAGSILPNYTLLKNSNLIIRGEIYLKIQQQLIANKDVNINDVKEIHSHPMAILQCQDFLSKYNWKIVETEDTALSIKNIKETQCKNVAGIGGTLARDLFDMKIVKKNINSVKENYTRFWILERGKVDKETANKGNKASVQFEVDNRAGCLAQILTRIHYYGINLTKVQSFPMPEKKWNYFFHTDMEFEKLLDFSQAIDDITRITKNIKIYGIYEKGKTV